MSLRQREGEVKRQKDEPSPASVSLAHQGPFPAEPEFQPAFYVSDDRQNDSSSDHFAIGGNAHSASAAAAMLKLAPISAVPL